MPARKFYRLNVNERLTAKKQLWDVAASTQGISWCSSRAPGESTSGLSALVATFGEEQHLFDDLLEDVSEHPTRGIDSPQFVQRLIFMIDVFAIYREEMAKEGRLDVPCWRLASAVQLFVGKPMCARAVALAALISGFNLSANGHELAISGMSLGALKRTIHPSVKGVLHA